MKVKIKTKRRICLAVTFLGLVLLLGTACESDLYGMALKQIYVRCITGLAMIFGGLYKGGYLK